MLKLSPAADVRRAGAAVSLMAVPLLALALRVTAPELSWTSAAEAVAVAAAHRTSLAVGSLVTMLIGLLLVPGTFAIVWLLRDRAGALGHLAAGLFFLGALGSFAVGALWFVFVEAAAPGADRDEMVALAGRVLDSPGVTVALASAILGYVLGPVVLAAALRRADAAPPWVAGALVMSQLLLVFGGELVDAVGYALLALGFGYVGVKSLTRHLGEDILAGGRGE